MKTVPVRTSHVEVDPLKRVDIQHAQPHHFKERFSLFKIKHRMTLCLKS